MKNLHSAREEILTLRSTVRQTRRALRKGTIDPLKATRIIAQTTRTIASLLRLQRRLNHYTNQQALMDQLLGNIRTIARPPQDEPTPP